MRARKQQDEWVQKTSDYWKEAKTYVKLRSENPDKPDWFSVRIDDSARWEWELYFAWRFGKMLRGLELLRFGTISEFLVPCENPRDFDHDYKG